MKEGIRKDGWVACIIACLLFYALLLFYRAPLFTLNDDLAIEEILSGRVSGTPDVHTVYMGVGLSFILSILYKVIPVVNWFGLFCVGAVVLSTAVFARRELLPGLAYMGMFLLSVFLLPHYTLVAASCGASALFLLSGKNEKEDSSDIAMAIVMLILCFQIRMQVGCMYVPFLIPVLCSRMGKEKKEGEKIPAGILITGAAVFMLLLLAQLYAYSSPEWKAYTEINRARTELYDYTGVWESDEAREYYRELGVSDAAYPLYKNYDLVPDEEADAKRLHEMALYREQGRMPEGSERIRKALYETAVSFIPRADDIFGYCKVPAFLLLGISAAVLFVIKKDIAGVLSVLLCFGLHLALYAYLAYRGRMPERVISSLYMADAAVMLGLLTGRSESRTKKAEYILMAVALGIMLIPTVRDYFRSDDMESRLAVNDDEDVLYSYIESHDDELFLLETYATVNRMDYALTGRKKEPVNCMLMGGWLYGSPLIDKKVERLGFNDAGEVFDGRGSVNLVFRYETGMDMTELRGFMEERYEDLTLTPVTILESKDAYFMIYKLEKIS